MIVSSISAFLLLLESSCMMGYDDVYYPPEGSTNIVLNPTIGPITASEIYLDDAERRPVPLVKADQEYGDGIWKTPEEPLMPNTRYIAMIYDHEQGMENEYRFTTGEAIDTTKPSQFRIVEATGNKTYPESECSGGTRYHVVFEGLSDDHEPLSRLRIRPCGDHGCYDFHYPMIENDEVYLDISEMNFHDVDESKVEFISMDGAGNISERVVSDAQISCTCTGSDGQNASCSFLLLLFALRRLKARQTKVK